MVISLIAFTVILVLLAVELPLGLTMLSVGYFGLAIVHPKGFDAANTIASQQILDLAFNYSFTVLPLFVMMGVFVAHAALSDDLYEASHKWLGHFRGGLAIATIAACGAFASVSGSSSATAATMTKVAIPSMLRYGYAPSLATATVAAGGTLGILFPPSAALIVYGLLTEEDIAKLFIAGIVPGLISVAIYMVVVRIVTTIRPEMGPPAEKAAWRERWQSLGRTGGILALFLLVMGGIFFGVFTSTEAGGIGSAGALAIAMLRRRMTWRILSAALLEAALTTSLIFTVAFGALVFNQFINLSGAPEATLAFIKGLDATPLEVVFVIVVIYIILGIFIDNIAMIFLTVPIFVPVIAGLNFPFNDVLIWWGVVLVILVEISIISPPIGINLFIIKSMIPEIPLSTIFKGVVPFFCGDLVRLAIMIFFPSTVLWLPQLMK